MCLERSREPGRRLTGVGPRSFSRTRTRPCSKKLALKTQGKRVPDSRKTRTSNHRIPDEGKGFKKNLQPYQPPLRARAVSTSA